MLLDSRNITYKVYADIHSGSSGRERQTTVGLSTMTFLQLVSIAVLAIVNPSVRPSVRHTLALSQNDSSYDHGVFTGG